MPTPPDCWVVRELHVRPEMRGQGLGAVLLRRAEEAARRVGHSQVALTTRTNNPARRLCERSGYHVVKKRIASTGAGRVQTDGSS